MQHRQRDGDGRNCGELRGLDEVGGGDGEHLREARGMSEAVRLRLGPRLELGLGPRLELGLG